MKTFRCDACEKKCVLTVDGDKYPEKCIYSEEVNRNWYQVYTPSSYEMIEAYQKRCNEICEIRAKYAEMEKQNGVLISWLNTLKIIANAAPVSDGKDDK